MNTIPHPGPRTSAGMAIDGAFQLLNNHVESLQTLARNLAATDHEAAKALDGRLNDLQLAVIVLHNAALAAEKAEAWASSRRYQFEGVCVHDVDQHLATVECKKVVRMGECPHCTADAGEHCIDLDGKIVPAHKTRPWSS